VLIAALALAARGLVRHTTWYLASDQFAFLTFADDLTAGHVFHDPTVVRLLAAPTLPEHLVADALYQTYFWRDGRLYSRYPPGYPLLLAGARAIAGETGRRILNPLLYLVLLVVLARLAYRALDVAPPDARLAAAAVAPWLLLLLPADVHYWGLTLSRDLPAHLLGLLAVLAALDGRLVIGAVVLGSACTIRPDAVLYALPIAVLAVQRRVGWRAALGAGGAFAVGALPLFLYNTVTQGHPLAFTQGAEFRALLSALAPIRPALAQSGVPIPSGGAFRVSNLARTLPAHLAYLVRTFGLFALIAAATLGWGMRRRLPLATALGAYALVALLFYSCWTHSDPRYLVGVSLCLVLLASAGTTLWCTRLADDTLRLRSRIAAIGLTLATIASMIFAHPGDPRLVAIEAALGSVAVLIASLAPRVGMRRIAPLAPALVLAAIGIVRAAVGSADRDPFQRPQIERARAAIEALLPPGALLLTTPALGRPAENITYYTHATAYYWGELPLLGSTIESVAARARDAGRRTFLLAPGGETLPIASSALLATAHVVANRSGPALRDWFVDPRGAPIGAVLYEIESPPL